jgi:hypothetical protein
MHRHIAEKSHLLLADFDKKHGATAPAIHSPTNVNRGPVSPAARALLVFATLVLATLAGPLLAHEDFPAEWCGGTDCRFAEPEDLIVECGAIRVKTAEFSQSTPFSQISRWNGDRPAICARNGKLNRCNPNKGDCTEQPGLGLLLPEDAYNDLRRRAARACRDRGKEAMIYGQSVPGLKLPTTGGNAWRPSLIGGGGGGGGGGSPTSPPYTTPYTPADNPGEEDITMWEPIPPLFLGSVSASVTAVPIPGTLGLLILTLGALGIVARRRK